MSTYERLGVLTWDSDLTVIKAASRKIKRKSRYARAWRADRHVFYRQILKQHHAWQKLCIQFRI